MLKHTYPRHVVFNITSTSSENYHLFIGYISYINLHFHQNHITRQNTRAIAQGLSSRTLRRISQIGHSGAGRHSTSRASGARQRPGDAPRTNMLLCGPVALHALLYGLPGVSVDRLSCGLGCGLYGVSLVLL